MVPVAKGVGNPADCEQRDNLFDSDFFQRADVRAVIHPVRRDGVVHSVARQKYQRAPGYAAKYQWAGRVAISRADGFAAVDLEPGQAIKAGSADDGCVSHWTVMP